MCIIKKGKMYKKKPMSNGNEKKEVIQAMRMKKKQKTQREHMTLSIIYSIAFFTCLSLFNLSAFVS